MDHSERMSSDTVSSLFPDRPIRPLPKRRLRERLSPETADSIKYPPSTPESIPLFYYPPYKVKDEVGQSGTGVPSSVTLNQQQEIGKHASAQKGFAGSAKDANVDAIDQRSTLVTRSRPEILNRGTIHSTASDIARHAEPPPPPSATSSVDGYDSFENASNKKKRKIPSASDPTLNGSHSLNTDTGSLSLPSGARSSTVDGHGDRAYQSSGYGTVSYVTTSPGMSGPGRGRLGRSRNGRSPLRALSDGNTTWQGRMSQSSSTQWSSGHQGTGIISHAIANAEKLPLQGQENVSLLQQQQTSVKSPPASTQFTFTCDSEVPGSIQWPGHPSRHSMGAQPVPGMSTVQHTGINHDGGSKAASGGSANSRRKSRRRLEKELIIAARHRKQAAAANYFHYPPKLDDVWICEFCEYERIFGEPPRALIRDYEIKDRRHRQEEADRKRLLEKAKAKSRKNKKIGRTPAKGTPTSNQTPEDGQEEHFDDAETPSMHAEHSHSTQSEDDYEDEFEENYPNLPPDINHTADDLRGNQIPLRTKA